MVFCSFIKRNKMMPFAGIWMDLESITVSKTSQTFFLHMGLRIKEGLFGKRKKSKIMGMIGILMRSKYSQSTWYI